METSPEDPAKKHTVWWLPVLLLAPVSVFSLLFLYYYFGPTPKDILGLTPKASAKATVLELAIAGTRLHIPAHYTRIPAERSSDTLPSVSMHALLPDLKPYAPSLSEAFDNNGPESRVVYFTLAHTDQALTEKKRLSSIYARYLEGALSRVPAPGLDRYTFIQNSGYKDRELFVSGENPDAPLLLLCYRETEIIFSPTCSRSVFLTDTLMLTYQYQRTHLAQWRLIDDTLTRLVKGFIVQTQGNMPSDTPTPQADQYPE